MVIQPEGGRPLDYELDGRDDDKYYDNGGKRGCDRYPLIWLCGDYYMLWLNRTLKNLLPSYLSYP